MDKQTSYKIPNGKVLELKPSKITLLFPGVIILAVVYLMISGFVTEGVDLILDHLIENLILIGIATILMVFYFNNRVYIKDDIIAHQNIFRKQKEINIKNIITARRNLFNFVIRTEDHQLIILTYFPRTTYAFIRNYIVHTKERIAK